MGADLEGKALIYQPIYVPSFTYVYELWVVTERMRLQIQVAKMSLLHRVSGLILRSREGSSDIPKYLRVEPLLLCVEMSQFRWFVNRIKMPPGCFPLEVIISSGFETLQDPPGGDQKCCWGEGWLDYLA